MAATRALRVAIADEEDEEDNEEEASALVSLSSPLFSLNRASCEMRQG